MEDDLDETSPGDISSDRIVDINQDLRAKLSSDKHDDTRIKLFDKAASNAILAFWIFAILLGVVVLSYIRLLFCNPESIPSNFWHIPTLVGLITVSILVSLLRFTSNFGNFTQGDKKSNNSNEEKSGMDNATLNVVDKLISIIDRRNGG